MALSAVKKVKKARMISLIICSRDAAALEEVSRSAAATIGVPYELIAIDNSLGRYGICEAYNTGAARARYDLLCFMHEDLRFHTADWGKLVADILADTSIGVVGVAGGTYEVDAPATWSSCYAEHIYMNVLHTANGKSSHDRRAPAAGSLAPVAVVDGLWMCCRKQVWQEFKFDALAFPGFHFYDVDFCTRVFPTYQICVTVDVLIEHFSYGSYTKPWYDTAVEYYDKRRAYLPFSSVHISAAEARQLRLQAFQRFISGYVDNGLTVGQGLRLLTECLAIAPFNRDSLWLLKKFIKARLAGSRRA